MYVDFDKNAGIISIGWFIILSLQDENKSKKGLAEVYEVGITLQSSIVRVAAFH